MTTENSEQPHWTAIDSETVWDLEVAHDYAGLPVGDVPSRIALRDLCLANGSGPLLLQGTRLGAAIRFSYIVLAFVKAENDRRSRRPNSEYSSSGPDFLMEAAVNKLNEIRREIGVTDLGYPWLDNISAHDHAALVELIEPTGADDDPDIKAAVLDKMAAPLLTFTGLVDHVSCGDDMRLLKDRPRSFSEAALKGHKIEPEPERWTDDQDLTPILRIALDEEAAKTKTVKVTKALRNASQTITLSTDFDLSVDVKHRDLNYGTISFEVSDKPAPVQPVPDPKQQPVGQ